MQISKLKRVRTKNMLASTMCPKADRSKWTESSGRCSILSSLTTTHLTSATPTRAHTAGNKLVG